MPQFDNGVSSPGGASFSAPVLNYGQFAQWANDFQQGQANQQQQGLNQQRSTINDQTIQQGQRQQEISNLFQGGAPKSYTDMFKAFMQKGDFDDAMKLVPLIQQQAAANRPQDPMLTGGAQPQGQPSSVAAPPLPAPSANSPQGDSSGSVISRVTDLLPPDSDKVGLVAGNVAKFLKVDPNSPLTAEQAKKADDWLSKYAERNNLPSREGTLPPSANAVSPAPRVTAAPARAAGGQPQGTPPAAPQPQQPQPPQAAPQQPQGGPIVPQVPLPPDPKTGKPFTDPQQAILALNAKAAWLSRQPGGKSDAEAMQNYAARIEKSIQPVEMGAGKTLLDPKTGLPIYQGNQPTMDASALHAAAERYLETGQLPPNMGRGAQGSANSTAIQNEAATLANARGVDMATLPNKWQQFKAQQVAIQRFGSGKEAGTIKSFNVLVDHLSTLDEAAQALKNGDKRLFNTWKQNWAAQTGDTAPTNFDGVKALVGDEIVKAVVGSAGALGDREEVKKDLDRASSPKQLAELVDRYRKLALGQLKGLRQEFVTSTGMTKDDFNAKLLPGTLASLGENKGKGSAPDAEGWVTLPNGARIQEVK